MEEYLIGAITWRPGAIFIKLPKQTSHSSENFKCIPPYLSQYYINETCHAYGKHCFS